jgi:hypothetical protein
MQPANLTSILFILLTFSLYFLILIGTRRTITKIATDQKTARRNTIRTALVLLFWLIFLHRISEMHILDKWDILPPRMMMVVLPPLIFTLLFTFSKKIISLLKATPVHWLIYIQSFRIIMEIILWQLYKEGVIPVQITFEGQNFDILIGLSAIPIAWLSQKGKISLNALLVWNITGLLFLLNVVVTAFLSTPLPIRIFMNDPPVTMVAYYPFVWLPGFVVPVAYSMHLFSIRQILIKKKEFVGKKF